MECGCKDPKFNEKSLKMRIIDSHHRVGCNVRLQKTLLQTLDQKGARGSHCVQFFLGGNTSYRCRSIDKKDKQKTLNYCDKYHKSFYIHCPYVVKLCKDVSTKEDSSSILSKSLNVVNKELNQISDLPGACIMHIGSKGTIPNLIENINDMNIQRGSHNRMQKQLILENASGQGTELGKTWEEMRHIFEGIDKNSVGLCIDTQHLFCAGESDFKDHESVIKLFDKVEEVYGQKPNVIHLNDSKFDYNERRDRHENINQGYIWNSNDESLRSLLNYCYEYDIDVILETPNPFSDLNKIVSKYMDLEIVEFYK